jgi:hypothetical protein
MPKTCTCSARAHNKNAPSQALNQMSLWQPTPLSAKPDPSADVSHANAQHSPRPFHTIPTPAHAEANHVQTSPCPAQDMRILAHTEASPCRDQTVPSPTRAQTSQCRAQPLRSLVSAQTRPCPVQPAARPDRFLPCRAQLSPVPAQTSL